MRLLFIGDIFAEAGRKVLIKHLSGLKKKYQPDVVIANGENMAGGSGVTPDTFRKLQEAGIEIFTGGNHSFNKKEGYKILDNEEDFCLRPANYPSELPGKGALVYTLPNGKGKLGVINVMGRTFMEPLDCPFRKAGQLADELSQECSCILVDFHAEASSEKVAMGWYLDGRVSLVLGTHTHIQTADERILPKGTAYITDVGMTGPYDSVIGVKSEIIVERYLLRRGRRFEPGKNNPWICGIVVDIDEDTGRAQKIQRIRIEDDRPETHPTS